MRKAIVIVLVLIVIAGLAVGAYFLFRPAKIDNQGAAIESGRHYYIHQLRGGMYHYPDEPGTPISLLTADLHRSNCKFDDNFKTFHVSIVGYGDEFTFDFVVTKITHNKGNSLTATVAHIYNGEIRTYTVKTTKKDIILTATVKYTVTVASEEYAKPKKETIERGATVMSFRRV